MPTDINIDTVIEMYLKQHGERAKARYEELFVPVDDDNKDKPTVAPDAKAESVEEGDHEDERSGKRQRKRYDVWDEMRELLPKPIVKMLREELEWVHKSDRPLAEYGLEMLLDDDAWTWPTTLEFLLYWWGVRAATYAVHAREPDEAFPIDRTLLYAELKARLRVLGITYRDDNDDDTVCPVDIAQNITAAVGQFRDKRDLTDWQVWSLVYDFAPRLLPAPEPLPTGPASVWMIACPDHLHAEVDGYDNTIATTWNINRNAKRGDLALMYYMAPRSAICSLFRVARDPSSALSRLSFGVCLCS